MAQEERTEGGMIDTFLRVGASFDWITPTIALIQDIRNGPSVQFCVPYDAGWSGAEVKELLNSVGIRVWGLYVEGEEITFTVREPQARYAAYWLKRDGLPYASSLAEEERVDNRALRPNAEEAVRPATPASRGGLLDNLLDGITGFVDGL